LDEDRRLKHPKRMRSDDGSLRLSLPHPGETHEGGLDEPEAGDYTGHGALIEEARTVEPGLLPLFQEGET
jgi:hypothetical protein